MGLANLINMAGGGAEADFFVFIFDGYTGICMSKIGEDMKVSGMGYDATAGQIADADFLVVYGNGYTITCNRAGTYRKAEFPVSRIGGQNTPIYLSENDFVVVDLTYGQTILDHKRDTCLVIFRA